MEMICSLLFIVPVGGLVSRFYVRKAAAWLDDNRFSTAIWWIPTGTVLVLMCMELIIVARMGAYQAHMRSPRAFGTLHMLVFVLGAPAVANATLLLSPRLRVERQTSQPAATLLCFLTGIVLFFANVAVSEDIYGIDGTGVRPNCVSPPDALNKKQGACPSERWT